MRSKADCGDKLNDVIREVGIPDGIHTDNAGEESGVLYRMGTGSEESPLIPNTFIEPHSPWMNRAEGEIGRFQDSLSAHHEQVGVSRDTVVLRSNIHVEDPRADVAC